MHCMWWILSYYRQMLYHQVGPLVRGTRPQGKLGISIKVNECLLTQYDPSASTTSHGYTFAVFTMRSAVGDLTSKTSERYEAH